MIGNQDYGPPPTPDPQITQMIEEMLDEQTSVPRIRRKPRKRVFAQAQMAQAQAVQARQAAQVAQTHAAHASAIAQTAYPPSPAASAGVPFVEETTNKMVKDVLKEIIEGEFQALFKEQNQLIAVMQEQIDELWAELRGE